MSFKLALILSLTFAAASFGSIALPYPSGAFLGASIFSLIWIAFVIYAIAKFRRRGLWILVGFPVAAFVPFYFFVGELMMCGGLNCN